MNIQAVFATFALCGLAAVCGSNDSDFVAPIVVGAGESTLSISGDRVNKGFQEDIFAVYAFGPK